MIFRLRTLAFYFADESRATAALASLRSLGVDDLKCEVAPLALDKEEGTILALSIEADRQPTVEELARTHGGRLVADVPEEWTHPTRPTMSPAGPTALVDQRMVD